MIKPRLVVSEEKNLKGRRIAGRVYNTKIRYSDKLSRKSAFIGFLKKKTKGCLRTRPFKQKDQQDYHVCAEYMLKHQHDHECRQWVYQIHVDPVQGVTIRSC